MPAPTLLDRLQRARLVMAELVLVDSVYAPIFRRIEDEIAALEDMGATLERARALLGQKASGSSKSRM